MHAACDDTVFLPIMLIAAVESCRMRATFFKSFSFYSRYIQYHYITERTSSPCIIGALLLNSLREPRHVPLVVIYTIGVSYLQLDLIIINYNIFYIFSTPWYAYAKDWMNYLQWCSVVLTLLIIPFRAVNHPGQWIVASMAYVFHGLKLTEYTSLFQ